MMRAVLEYTDCLQDGRKVYLTLSKKKIEILKSKRVGNHPIITVLVYSRAELSELLNELNKSCTYGVRLKRVYKSRQCDCCEQNDHCSIIHMIRCTIKNYFNSLKAELNK